MRISSRAKAASAQSSLKDGGGLKAWPYEASRRGSALLAVLWVSAALAAIAFSLSNTVLGETQRTSTAVDGLRSQYLAAGGVWRAIDELHWSMENPGRPGLNRTMPFIDYTFPSGVVHVEVVPETAKLNVNLAPPEELYRLLMALGLDPTRAGTIAGAIVARRTSVPGGGAAVVSLVPSFQSGQASFEEIEELLQVTGITPEIFYGTYTATPEGTSGPRLVPRPGLQDCLSVFGSQDGRIDANTATPAVLTAIGLSPDAVYALVAHRQTTPLTEQQLPGFVQSIGARADRLRVGGNSIYTMRGTARLRLPTGQLSDLRRTVAAQVKYLPMGPLGYGTEPSIHVLRWYDTAWSH